MHQDTKREIIENGTGVIGSVLKELLVHRSNMEAQREIKDREIELARIKHSSEDAAKSGTSDDHHSAAETVTIEDPSDPNDSVTATPAEIEAAIDDLVDEEMCSICRDLLIALKDRPVSEQVRGIMEYGTFKRELAADAGVDQLQQLLRETTVLQSIFQEKFTGPAPNE